MLRPLEPQIFLIIHVERAEIGKDPPAYAKLVGQSERYRQRHRAEIILVAAKRITRDCVARPNPGGSKTAQIVAADKEPVLQEHLVPTPAEDVTDFPGEAQNPFRRDGVIIAGIHLVTDVSDTKSGAG